MAEDVDRPPVTNLAGDINADVFVCICVPSGENVKANFMRSLLMAALKFCQTDFRDKDGKLLSKAVGYVNTQGSILPAVRESTARQALLRKGVTHLLWIDSDMTFPDDLIHRLWAHDLDVVGANCARKIMPTVPTCERLDGSPMFTTEKSTGMEETKRIGFGVLMTKADVYWKIPEPWFPFTYDHEVHGYDGEDTNFCRALRKAGYRLWVDHDLSKQIGHVGAFTFDHMMNEEYWGRKSPERVDKPNEITEVAA